VAFGLVGDVFALSVKAVVFMSAIGTTDIGVEVLVIIGMYIPPSLEELGYHTPNDTVERIEPEAVAACLEIAYHYILDKDRLG